MGEDISGRLDIQPAQFFVQRQIRGYPGGGPPAPEPGVQVLPAPGAGAGRAPGLDNALPTPGLQAQTVLSRFVDHITYDRQQQINARSGVRTPRSTLAACSGHTGAPSLPL